MYSYIEQMSGAIGQCRVFHGFTENYLDGIQPSWCSIPYQAIQTYRQLKSADVHGTLPAINENEFLEVLQMTAPRYKLSREFPFFSMK